MNFDQIVYLEYVEKYDRLPVVIFLRKIPCESLADEVRAVLRGYGQVLNMRWKMSEGDDLIEDSTGRASALMYIVSHFSPAVMIIQESKIFVSYDGQPKLCFISQNDDHDDTNSPRNNTNQRRGTTGKKIRSLGNCLASATNDGRQIKIALQNILSLSSIEAVKLNFCSLITIS